MDSYLNRRQKMLTRKDFIRMAAEIAAMPNRQDAQRIADYVAQVSKASNSRFDTNRFMTACGL
jgi:hypothetical protein